VLEIEVNRQVVVLKDQFQTCAPSMWLQTPLVSGILAASPGVLPIASSGETVPHQRPHMNIPNSDYVLAELGIFMCGR
jgi:hypothetical protein